MPSKPIIPCLILIVGLALSSCSKEDLGISNRQGNSTGRNEFRFVLMQGQRQLQNGQFVPVVLRMDSTTGETSILAAGDIPKWEMVQDTLRLVYKMDPKTKKWGLGIALPDGRDINELSKEEELIRIVQSMSRTQQITNPNDPLGIRGETVPKRLPGETIPDYLKRTGQQ